MHVVLRKLESLNSLSEEEKQALLAVMGPPITIEKGRDIAADGSMPKQSTAILSGIGCRYKILADGKRQIVALQYPGDMVDLYSYVLKRMDHAVGAMTTCTISHIDHEEVRRLCAQYPNLGYAFWRDTMVDASVFQMWIVGLGRRSARERLAHLFCEQFLRLANVGLAKPGTPIDLYLTQADLADATGLSMVHLNRTLQELRGEGVIDKKTAYMTIIDWKRLQEIAGFDPSYLHLRELPFAIE